MFSGTHGRKTSQLLLGQKVALEAAGSRVFRFLLLILQLEIGKNIVEAFGGAGKVNLMTDGNLCYVLVENPSCIRASLSYKGEYAPA